MGRLCFSHIDKKEKERYQRSEMKIFLLIVTVGTAVAGIVKDKDKDLPSEPSLSSKANIDSSQIEDRQDKQDSLLTPVLHQTKPDSLPEILVNNPTTGLSVQTLPSPIQFAQAVPKQPYIPGQNKQQFTKPFPATPDTPLYYLLRSDSQTKPYPAGYTVARNTPPTDTASEYSGLKTLLYIF